jgi:hypothetical protein
MSGRIPTECHRPTVSSMVSYYLFCFLVFSGRGDESAPSDARGIFCHWCSEEFVDSSLCDETAFQVVSDCAVMRRVLFTLSRHFLYLVSVFRRALPIGGSWSRDYSTSSRPTTPSGMRPISSGGCMARIPLSLQPWGRRTPFLWQCIWEDGCGGGFMDPSALSGHWTGELCFVCLPSTALLLTYS